LVYITKKTKKKKKNQKKNKKKKNKKNKKKKKKKRKKEKRKIRVIGTCPINNLILQQQFQKIKIINNYLMFAGQQTLISFYT
jgi:hypothetical protein